MFLVPHAVVVKFKNSTCVIAVITGFFLTHLQADPAADVQLLLDSVPAAPGSYVFPFPAGNTGLVLDNGLVRFNFNRDDAAGGVVTGWDGSTPDRPATVSITAVSIVVDGTELAHNLDGVSPRDPDRQHSFYIDAGGGSSRLVCTEIRVLRSTPELAEVAFIDNTSLPLQHEHHLIMRRGKPGLYGYDILTASAATSISEVRMNARWDRSILDHSFNWERGGGQQPTYAYLATQTKIGDETWRVDGVNNPALPSPDSNSGNMPAGSVYTKYNWSLYHHENPMFGHYGHGFGVWLTPLGGVTDQTLCAFYGVGPNHQDLAIHQDALILNYFGPNHYGLPGYSLASGYRRLYGPWFTYITAGDPANVDAMVSHAADIAESEILENRSGSDWMSDTLYADPSQRATVTGHIEIADGRPSDGLWVLLSTQNATDVYTIHEPTYFVKTDSKGDFTLPGIPPAFAAGTTNPSTYVLYIFSTKGSITDQYKQTGITVSGPATDLGTITWAPTNYSTFLWQIGKADRLSGEFALATNLTDLTNSRSYEKPSLVPGDLTWTVGSSWEPEDWYYAQTNAGVWTISFNLDRVYTGTAHFTVSTSMQQGGPPVVTVNGSNSGISGSLPPNTDSTITRQTDRSGYPRSSIISFPASRLVLGWNTISLTKASGGGAGSGPGWDTLLLEADETVAPPSAQLTATITAFGGSSQFPVWTVRLANIGSGSANDARVDAVAFRQPMGQMGAPAITGRDPNKFAVPLGNIAAGSFVDYFMALDFTGLAADALYDFSLPLSANGGRSRTYISAHNVGVTPVEIVRGGYSLNRRLGLVVQEITLKNNASVAVAGPLYLALDDLSSNTSLVNSSGLTMNNPPTASPYLMAFGSELAPGASISLNLEFSNPISGGISYTPRVLAGDMAP